jgi:hypothetical protein
MANMITISNKELEAAGFGDCDLIKLEEIPRFMLLMKREEVLQAYMDAKGFTKEELATYEFGIDDWIGFGSVTCFELGGGTLVGYGYNEIQMVVL